jgi:hypothetical protein
MSDAEIAGHLSIKPASVREYLPGKTEGDVDYAGRRDYKCHIIPMP